MKNQDIPENHGSEGYPPDGIDVIEDEDDWDDHTPSEHEKETYIKYIAKTLANIGLTALRKRWHGLSAESLPHHLF